MAENNRIIICDSCGEKLEYKDCYAKEHWKKYPMHNSYTIRDL
jgi:hypothetical protein